MTWKEFIYQLVIEYCKAKGADAFTLSDFYGTYAEELRRFAPDNHHIQAKVRQQIQFLRKDNLLTFVDNHGAYQLSGESLLKVEITPRRLAPISPPLCANKNIWTKSAGGIAVGFASQGKSMAISVLSPPALTISSKKTGRPTSKSTTLTRSKRTARTPSGIYPLFAPTITAWRISPRLPSERKYATRCSTERNRS